MTAVARSRRETPRESSLAAAVRTGLTARPKRLPAWMLYDALGSALFDEITTLPEYYLTRTEAAILEQHASAMLDVVGTVRTIVELGAGSAAKTPHILRAVVARQWSARYVPVDVSRSALDEAVAHLAPAFPSVEVAPAVARYPDELGFLSGLPGRRLVLFLGSSVGNQEPAAAAAMLRAVRRRLSRGDALLVGADLPKDPGILLPAYDDAAGVTARFELNVLTRINRELGGAFDPRAFRHVARWNDTASRVELYLESLEHQIVRVDELDLDVRFARGELLHTENSYKWSETSLRQILTAAGFSLVESFRDPRGWFGVHVARV